jgi:hypothetical protein
MRLHRAREYARIAALFGLSQLSWASHQSYAAEEPPEIPYPMLVSSMVHQGLVVETARKITVEVPQELLEKASASQRYRHHSDGSYGAAAPCGLAHLCSLAPTPRQGPLHS